MIFLDMGFLFAFVSEEDEVHSRVDAVLEEYRGRTLSEIILTTNHVVAPRGLPRSTASEDAPFAGVLRLFARGEK